jgi:hypothetical protein
MATIQWRPEPNPLTTPPSWRIRFLPRNTAACKDIAADIAADHPNYHEVLAESIPLLRQVPSCLGCVDAPHDGNAPEETVVLVRLIELPRAGGPRRRRDG